MRVRNKELKKRWARKAQRIKELIKEAKAAGGAPKKVKAVKKAAPAVDTKPKVEKAKKAPAKKKADAVAEVAPEVAEAPAE